MLKIRDSELASILGDEQLRSLGFVLHARGRWLRKQVQSPRRCGGGDPLSPRPAGVTKRPPRCHVSAGPSVRSRGSSASFGSRAGSSASRHRQQSPLRRGGPGRGRWTTSGANPFSPPRHASPRSGSGGGCPSSPSRQCQAAALPSTSRDPLGAVAYSPPLARPCHDGERPCPTAQSFGAAAAPGRRSLHKQHVPPIPVDVWPHGMGGWPRSGQTSMPSLSPVARPRFLPKGEGPSPAPPAAPNRYPWTRLGALSGETASAVAAGDSYEGHSGSHERNSPSFEQGSWSDRTTYTPSLRGGRIMSPASASQISSSSVSSVVSRLSYDDQLALHEALPRVFPRPGALPSAAPSPPRIPSSEPLAHLPTELRLDIVNELGPADMLALRRAYPVAFGFIYGEDARYQRLYVVEKLVARKAERNLWWAEGPGAASPDSLAADRRRLEQFKRDIRPRRESLLQYALEKGYPADDIDALVHAYQEESSIDLLYHLGLEGIGQGRPGQKIPMAASKARSC